jgi:hypothetical protein
VWKTVIDISEQLNTYMKESKWKDVEDQSESKHSKRPTLDETQHKILGRSFFMATTAFVWSEALTKENGDLHSFFVTAQKNGILILWKVKVLSNFTPVNCKPGKTDGLEIEVSKILKPRIGMISSLELLQLDDKTSALFIGGLNGKLKVSYCKYTLLLSQ